MLFPILLSLSFFLFTQASKSYTDISVSNLSPTQGITLDSQISPNMLGYRVKSAGDFNGDGFNDVIMSSPGAVGGFGAVYVIFGSKTGLADLTVTTGLTASQGMVIYGASPGDKLGEFASNAGDINGDGIDDIIIGSSLYQYSKGIVYVIYGKQNLPAEIDLSQILPLIRGFKITGAAMFDSFGRYGSRAGDINKDGIDDFVIGASGLDGSKGAAIVIFGYNGTRNHIDLGVGLNPSDGFAIIGAAANNYLGTAVSDAGDIDGDGIEDIIVGAYGVSGLKGAAYVIYGRDSPFSTIDLSGGLSPSQGFTITVSSTNAQLGKSLGKVGDFNGDGRADVIIGASGESAAYVIFGNERSSLTSLTLNPAAIDSTRAMRIKGIGTGSGFAVSVDGVGDINGDGIDDIIVGALLENNAGGAYVIFGKKNPTAEVDLNGGMTPQEGFRINGGAAGDYLGCAVASAGDVNGDGMGDLLVGSYGVQGNSGAVYLLFTAVVCPENCLVCEEFGVCQFCETGFKLENSKCIIDCPPKTKLENGVCVPVPEPPEPETPSPGTPIPTPSPTKTVTKVSKGLFDSGSTASRIFTMGRSLSVGLGLIAKIIQNVRFLDIDYPEETLNAFETYGTDLFELPIPEAFYESPETKELSSQYARYDMEPSFLENYWDTIMVILICLSMFLVIKLVQFLTKSQRKDHIAQVALKTIGQTVANYLVIQIYSNLDDVIFFLLLDISSTKMNSSSAGISMGVAIFFLLIGLALVFFHCWLLGRYQLAKSKGNLERFEAKYRILGTLFEDFKDDSIAKQSFFGILILRCVVLVLVIMLLGPPWMQASILMLTNLVFLAYFIYQRPFKNRLDEISQYFCELTVFAAYLCVLILSIMDAQNVEKSSLRNGLGKCIVLAGIILCLGGFIIQIIQLIGAMIGICKYLKNYYCRKEVQVSMAFNQSQSIRTGTGRTESSSILRHTSPIRLTDHLELVSLSQKNQRISPKKKSQDTVSELEISSLENNDNVFLNQFSRTVVPRIVIPKREAEGLKIQALGSHQIHRGLQEGSSFNSNLGGFDGHNRPVNNPLGPEFVVQRNNDLARRRKIKRQRRNLNLPDFYGNVN